MLRRGIWTGLVFGAAYFCAEVLGTAGMLAWLGAGVEILLVLRRELTLLFVEYCVFGLVIGIATAPVVQALERGVLRRFAGPGLNFMAMALVCIAIAYLWNPESILPRRAYLFLAFGAQAVILVVGGLLLLFRKIGFGRLTTRLARPLRTLPGVIVAALLLVVLATAALREPPPELRQPGDTAAGGGSPPNIVLIVLDTLRRDHVSAYGYGRQTSPNIDRIAAEGTLFEKAHTTASWTLPAHASLFTGLYTSSHETDNGRLRLGADKTTIAELLTQKGYRTAGFSANPWLSSMSGLGQGFETFEYLGIQTTTSGFFLNLVKDRASALLGLDRDRDLGARAVTSRLLSWMDSAKERPFFLFVNYMEVHEPYGEVPEPYFSEYLKRPLPRDIGRAWVRETPLFLCSSCDPTFESSFECRDGSWHIRPQQLEDSVDLYDAGLRYVDTHVGRVYDALRSGGILDNTVVIITSDHGESLGERGQMGHGGYLYNSVLDIPLIIRWPRQFPAGSRVSESVSLVDVLPTIEEVVGIPATARGTARSLVPGSGLETRPDRVLSEYVPIEEKVWTAVGKRLKCDYQTAGRESAALQQNARKFIWNSTGRYEFYDLDSDPREERNVLGQHPDQAKAMMAELLAWRKALEPAESSGENYELDPATKKTLESLGYVR